MWSQMVSLMIALWTWLGAHEAWMLHHYRHHPRTAAHIMEAFKMLTWLIQHFPAGTIHAG